MSASAMPRRCRRARLHRGRFVGIQKADGVALEQVKTLVHGVVDALVLLGEDADCVGTERLDDLEGRVAGRAVDHQHLLFGMALLEKRLDREADRRLGIVARSDDADLHFDLRVRNQVTEADCPCQKISVSPNASLLPAYDRQLREDLDFAHSGTPIGADPLAAFSALKIHTSPPNAPTINDTAPNSSETLTPSLLISPA